MIAVATLTAAVTGGTFIAVAAAAPPIVAGIAAKILLFKAFKIVVSGLKIAHIVSSTASANVALSGAFGATIGGVVGGSTAFIAFPVDANLAGNQTDG